MNRLREKQLRELISQNIQVDTFGYDQLRDLISNIEEDAVLEYKKRFAATRETKNLERYRGAVRELESMGVKPTLQRIASLMGLKSRASAIYYKDKIRKKFKSIKDEGKNPFDAEFMKDSRI